jgi:hypothetical protein
LSGIDASAATHQSDDSTSRWDEIAGAVTSVAKATAQMAKAKASVRAT